MADSDQPTRKRIETAQTITPSDAESWVDPKAGSRVGRYTVIRTLGKGGMGQVLMVDDPELGRPVALKIARSCAEHHVARFMHEARVCGQLEHPNIVPVHELGVTSSERRPYFTMRVVEGQSLHELLEGSEEAPIPLVELLRVFLKVCDGIGFAHSRGVIHRDMKPGNVMVGQFGEVQVMDWGLAKVLEDPDPVTTRSVGTGGRVASLEGVEHAQTIDGTVVGTPAYMPPEQAAGEVDRLDLRSDIYALGAILYQILTLELPFPGKDLDSIIAKVVAGDLVPPSARRPDLAIPWELEAVVTKAMALDPADRYGSVVEMGGDIEAYLSGRTLGAARYSPGQLLVKWIRRHKVGVGAALAVVGCGLVFAGVSYWRIGQSLSEERQAREGEARQRSEAERQRTEAVSQRAEAERQQAEAERQHAEGERQRDRVVQLSDLAILVRLEEEARTLWPPVRDKVPALRAWLARADALAGRLDAHRRELARLRTHGSKQGEEWVFRDEEHRWLHENIARLVAGLERFTRTSRQTGTRASVRWRLEQARTLWTRSIERHADRWKAAIKAIREAPAYGGLKLEPMEGLVPLGPDPASKLWEFGHVLSGQLPGRDAGTGKLRATHHHCIVLVLIPGGRFWMGAQRQQPKGQNYDPGAQPPEAPVHQVTLRPFLISKFEVTQTQWWELTGETPSFYGRQKLNSQNWVLHPVEHVSQETCDRVMRQMGLALPTEAQWEYAARAGTSTVWWTGNGKESLRGAANLADLTYRQQGGHSRFEQWSDRYSVHAPVGLYRANRFGLHDVAGNVAEWCRDRFGSYRLPVRVGDGLREGATRRIAIYRGGGMDFPASGQRSAYRLSESPTSRFASIGCRPSKAIGP